jgi:hypothetical protein
MNNITFNLSKFLILILIFIHKKLEEFNSEFVGDFMKKIIYFIFIFTSSYAWAGWEIFNMNESEGSNLVFLYDSSTIKKNGEVVKVWTMFNSDRPKTTTTGKKYSSAISLKIYNCKEVKTEILHLVFYSGLDGTGNSVQSHDWDESEIKMKHFVPNSIDDSLYKIVCKNK